MRDGDGNPIRTFSYRRDQRRGIPSLLVDSIEETPLHFDV